MSQWRPVKNEAPTLRLHVRLSSRNVFETLASSLAAQQGDFEAGDATYRYLAPRVSLFVERWAGWHD